MSCLPTTFNDEVSIDLPELKGAQNDGPLNNVLIVEDDLVMAELLSERLETDGYCVTDIARTVDTAIASAARCCPDFAIIDIRLANGGCGIDVARHLRRHGGIGIIFSTGNSEEILGVEDGDAVMTKPYRMRDVARALQIISGAALNLPLPRNCRLLSPSSK
jgi:two-component system, response regulator PdtaR